MHTPEHTYLIAITTYNQSAYTRRCFESLGNHIRHVIVCDDRSTDDTEDLCREFSVPIFRNERPLGLSSLWNKAFHYFINSSAQKLIISNNDVLFPDGALEHLLATLDQHYYAGVLTRRDDSSFAKLQYVEEVLDTDSLDANNPEHRHDIQKALSRLQVAPLPVDLIYGFCFGLSRDILPFTFNETTLLDPRLVNTGGERALANQIPEKVICRQAFVYHVKGVSCGPIPHAHPSRDPRNDLTRYHQQGVSLKHRWQALLIRLKRITFYGKQWLNRLRKATKR